MTIAVFISGDDSKEYPLYKEVTGIEQSPQQDTGTSSTDENGGCDDDDECDEQVQYFKIAKKTNELVVIALRRVNSQNVANVDALRNAINPLITMLGFEFAGLLSGAALTEYVFQYPGLGRLVLEAVMKSDINLVMASLMIGSVMLVLGNLIADILLKITDPRVRVE